MISEPKFVKKANSYVVTMWDGDPRVKKNKQTQNWFTNLDEALLFIKQQKVVNS